MIFVIAFDPESIRTCARQGPIGCDHLVGILQALLQNCLMAEICGTWRLSAELMDAVKEIPDQDTRKKATTILEKFLDPNRYRFVDVISGFEEDYESEAGSILVTQSKNSALDVIVCEKEVIPDRVETVLVHRFNQSNFARDRSRKACALVCAPRTRKADELFREAFSRLIQHTDTVTIFDRVIGEEFNDNYFYGIEHWCEFFRQSGHKISLRLHTTRGQERRIRDKLNKELAGSCITHDVIVHDKNVQPHDRFLRTGVFTLDIGRGIDLIDDKGDCRDVKIGLSDHGAFTRDWGHLENRT